MTEEKWSDDYGKILSVGSFLVEVKGYKANDLLYFFEKPHKFNMEYKELQYYVENEIYPYGDKEFTGFVNPHLRDIKLEESK